MKIQKATVDLMTEGKRAILAEIMKHVKSTETKTTVELDDTSLATNMENPRFARGFRMFKKEYDRVETPQEDSKLDSSKKKPPK